MFSTSLVSHSKKQPARWSRGFGLVELMVSISIMVIVSAVILARQSSFNSAVLLRSQAYEIALQLREVQLNAVSATSDGSGNFRSLLGVHFDENALANDTYRIFRDADNDNFYDMNEEFGLQGRLDRRFEIRNITPVGDTMSGTALSVVFQRPNFDARFFDGAGSEVNATSVEIEIGLRGSPDSRTIEITAAGQIAVLGL